MEGEMISKAKVRIAILMTASMLIIATIAVLACAPASPQGQSDDSEAPATEPTATPTATPTMTPTPDPDCYEIYDPNDKTWQTLITVCPEPGPKNIEPNLRKKYNDHMATKEAPTDGRRSTQQASTLTVDIMVDIKTNEHLPAIEAFMRSQPTGRIQVYRNEPPPNQAAIVAYHVDIELVPTIAAMDGVKRSSRNYQSPSHKALPHAHSNNPRRQR